MIYALIILLPLIGFLAAGLGGHVLGARSCEIITSSLTSFSAFLSWFVFFSIGFSAKEPVIVPLFEWLNVGHLHFHWSLYIDSLTAVMLVVVTTISALVHIYSIGYMQHDSGRPRFFAYLSLFTFMMLMLVSSDNLLQMFFGWEGVGLVSYLLIGFWFERSSANRAAIKAFVTNRVGDFGFLLGIFVLYYLFETVYFREIFSAVTGGVLKHEISFLNWHISYGQSITIACLLLFMGAMGKSAQFFLHTWLPDAMEGPTPVSALIHAATMVTAGIFMIARLSPVFELSPNALEIITWFGAITAFFAATVGMVQNDIKRVIAYSTCSQLGYMFAALGVGAYGAAMFHLFTHAFFKALLFLGAGSVIHALSDEQDMRRMGGLKKHIPYTYWMMLVGTLALTGFGIPNSIFGMAGFVSKDAIIESVFVSGHSFSHIIFYMLVIAAFLTSFYSWRLMFLTFHGKSRVTADILYHIHESPRVMLIPLVMLSVGAIFAGMIFAPYFIGTDYFAFWKGALFLGPDNHILEDMHHVPLWVKFSPFMAMFLGFATAFMVYIASPALAKQMARRFPRLYNFFYNKWYFDELYQAVFVRAAFLGGQLLWKIGDVRIIDHFGPNGVAARVLWMTNRVVKLQTGYLYHYAFAMLLGLVILISWMLLRGVI